MLPLAVARLSTREGSVLDTRSTQTVHIGPLLPLSTDHNHDEPYDLDCMDKPEFDGTESQGSPHPEDGTKGKA